MRLRSKNNKTFINPIVGKIAAKGCTEQKVLEIILERVCKNNKKRECTCSLTLGVVPWSGN